MGKKIRLIAENYDLIGGKLVASSRDINAIFEFDIEKQKVKIINVIPEMINNRISSRILSWENKLVAVPQKTNRIWIFEQGSAVKSVDVPWIGERVSFGRFFQGYIYKDILFLIGAEYPAVLRVDLKSLKTSVIDVYSHLKEKQRITGEIFSRNKYAVINEKIYFVSTLTNEVACLNMEDGSYLWHTVGKDDMRYSSITWDGKFFWLTSRIDTSIVRWDGLNTYEYINTGVNGSGCCLLEGALFDRKIYIAGMDIDASMIIDVDTKKVEILTGGHYVTCKCLNDQMLVMQNEEGELSIITKNGIEKKYYLEIDIDDIKACWNKQGVSNLDLLNSISIKEGVVLDLKSYIDELVV